MINEERIGEQGGKGGHKKWVGVGKEVGREAGRERGKRKKRKRKKKSKNEELQSRGSKDHRREELKA